MKLPTCLSSAVFNRVRNPFSTGGEISGAVPELQGPCDLTKEGIRHIWQPGLRIWIFQIRKINNRRSRGGLLIGDVVGGGIWSTNSSYAQKSCKSWKDNESRATQAVSNTGNDGNHAAWCPSMRG